MRLIAHGFGSKNPIVVTGGTSPQALTRSEQHRIKACAKALLLDESALRPRLGRFSLLRLIGRGAHGAVYEATDLESGEVLALKTLRTRDARAIYGFKQEFRGLAGIVHENLVHLHELFVDGDEWYFTMELVRGTDFASHVCCDGEASPEPAFARLRPAFAGLLTGVHAIHAAGKLHCDLKPSNVQVAEDGRVVVLDYGLVSASEVEEPEDGARAERPWRGTPEYLAPELITHFAPTRASDVYAMGVMLFVALTGRLPFPGRTEAALERKRHEDPPRARSLAPATPPDLDALCAAMMARDPRDRPLLEQLLPRFGVQLSGATEPPLAPEASYGLVGRDAELSELSAAFARAASGHATAVFIAGASGIGKTALIERFSAQVAPNACVLAGRCYEREAVPFKAFDGIIDALGRFLATRPASPFPALAPAHANALLQVFPALSGIAGLRLERKDLPALNRQETRQQAFGALKQILRELSRERPIVLVADDLQWADLDSARLLLELLGPPAAPALLYVGCYRSEDVEKSEFLRELLDARTEPPLWEKRVLALAPLPPEQSSALALQLLRDRLPEATDVARRIADEARGVPLLVCELARHVLAEGDLHSAAPSIEDLLASRVASVPPQARVGLLLLALAGRPVPTAVFAHALRAEERWQLGLRALEVAGLVRRDPHGALIAYHDRVRELAIARSLPDERTALHERLARAYEHAGTADPEWLIGHFQNAGQPARALEYAVVAADSAAQKLAFNRAAVLYRTAIELCADDEPRKRQLSGQLADTLAYAGRNQESADAYIAAIDPHDRDAALLLRCRAVQQRLRGTDMEAVSRLVRALLAEVGIPFPESALESSLRIAGCVAMIGLRRIWKRAPRVEPERARRIEVLRGVFREFSVVDPMRGFLFQKMFYAEALRASDPESIFAGLTWETYNTAFVAGARAREGNRKRLVRLEALAAELGTPYARASLDLVRTALALFEGRYTEVEAPAAAAQSLFGEECVGALWEESVVSGLRYTGIEITGPIRRLGEELPALSRRAVERGDTFSDGTITMAMSLGLLARDEPDAARALVSQRRLFTSDPAMPRFLLANRLMDCRRYAGENATGWDEWNELWPGYRRTPYDRLGLLRIMMHHQRARCAVALNAQRFDPKLAAIAEHEARVVADVGRTESPGLSGATRAALAWQRGQRARARELLTGALDAATSAGILAYAACFRRQLGQITGGPAGDRLVKEADAALRDQGIARPERWVEIYAPGFGASG